MEIGGTLSETVDAYHNVAKWSKPDSVRWSFNFFAMKPSILKEPKGVVLIISPFNYPVWLLLGPLVRSHRASPGLTSNAFRYRQGPLQQATPARSNLLN